jgi:putative glutamine transport system substrate-binding protein
MILHSARLPPTLSQVTGMRFARSLTPILTALLLSSCGLFSQPGVSPSPTPTPTQTGSAAPTRPRLELSSYQYALQTRGKIRVGVRDFTAPFSARVPSGAHEGFEADIAREIARAIWGANEDPDTHIEWVSIDASTRLTALTGNQADIVLAALMIDDDTAKVIDLSDTYYKDGQRLLVKKTNDDIKELVDLVSNADTATAVKGSPWEANIRRITNERVKVLPLDTVEFCLQALTTGAADAFTQDEATLVTIAAKDPNVKIVSKQFTEDRLGIGIKQNVSADRQGFKEFVNTALLKIVADRTWAKLFEKHITPWTGDKKQLPTD